MATIRVFNNHLRVPFLLLGIVEAILFYMAMYIAVMFRFNETTELSTAFGNTAILGSVFTVVMMLAMTALGQYKSHQYLTPSHAAENILRILVSLILANIMLIVLYYIFPSLYIGRGVSAISIAVAFFFIVLTRTVFDKVVDADILKRRILVVGAGKNAANLINEKGGTEDGLSYQLVGYVRIQNEDIAVPEHKLLSLIDQTLEDFVLENEIDEIVLALEDRRISYPTNDLVNLRLKGVLVVDPVTFLEQEQGKVNLELLKPSWIIFSRGFNRNSLKALTDRTFDVVSSLTLLTMALPVLLITAFIIAAESGFKHPIFYRQTRVGLNGKTFSLMKFRSMKVDAEKGGAVWAKKNDDRITMTGKFIRKTRIDELPQIINILKGDMRLVGPRPERPEFVDNLNKDVPFYSQRHSVKPGLAGWAQLKYPYGASERDAYEKLQYDLFYVKNHNILMDFFILLQTIEIVILGKGAR